MFQQEDFAEQFERKYSFNSYLCFRLFDVTIYGMEFCICRRIVCIESLIAST